MTPSEMRCHRCVELHTEVVQWRDARKAWEETARQYAKDAVQADNIIRGRLKDERDQARAEVERLRNNRKKLGMARGVLYEVLFYLRDQPETELLRDVRATLDATKDKSD